MAKKAYKYCLGISSAVFVVLGLVFIVGGTCVYMLKPPVRVLTNQLEQKMTIQEGHITYEQLQSPSLNIFKDFYFFNFTNCDDFAKTGGKAIPHLVELGPYSFIERRNKKLIETGNQTELNYTQTRAFIFDPTKSASNLSDTDIICTINVPLVTAIAKMKDNVGDRRTLNSIISDSNAKIYVCLKPEELALGYTDEFISAAYKKDAYSVNYFGIQPDRSSPDQNNSTINTGIPDIAQVGQIIQWNGTHQLNKWQKGTDADEINGTEGLFFKPGLEEGENLTIFDEDVLRSFDLVYKRLINHFDMPTYRYRVNNKTYSSAFSEPKNAQYFSWCPKGMFNLSAIQPGHDPIFGSKPHFLDGDPQLAKSVSGLTPHREKHDSIMDVEPITGISVFFHKRLQINIQVNKTKKEVLYTIRETENITGYNNSGVLYLPVAYVDENAEITQDFRDYLEVKGLSEIYVANVAAPIGFALVLIFGVFFILISLGLVCTLGRRSSKRDKYYAI